MMRFIHLADCHLGGWREARLKEMSDRAFKNAVDLAISEKVDSMIIAGDLFNTALPSIDELKFVVGLLKKMNDNNINVYIVPGSHDFSSAGKTIIDILETAGLLINVSNPNNFFVDKSSVKIIGIEGRKGMLDSLLYQKLGKERLENEVGEKVFVFHTLVNEVFSAPFVGESVNNFPRGFDYYAGGHIHKHIVKEIEDYGLFVYPGALFPNNFLELEESKDNCGFYLVELLDGKLELKYFPTEIEVESIRFNVDGKTPFQINADLGIMSEEFEVRDKIAVLRVEGQVEGKISDINLQNLIKKLYEKGAVVVLKNTLNLRSKEFEETKIEDVYSLSEIEDKVILEKSRDLETEIFKDKDKVIELTKTLLKMLETGRREGEMVADFEEKVKGEIDILLGATKIIGPGLRKGLGI